MTEYNIVIILYPNITIECGHLIKCLEAVLSECSGSKCWECFRFISVLLVDKSTDVARIKEQIFNESVRDMLGQSRILE